LKILGVILAGGASSRFGSDKALAEVEGKALISHVAHSLRSCDGIAVIGRGNDPSLEAMGLEQVPDLPGDKGPALGLISALQFARERDYSHIFLTSCDMWGLRTEWPLLIAGAANPASAIFDGRWQPMCSAWRSDLTLSNVQSGGRGPSLKGFLEQLDAIQVTPPEGWEDVCSINTPSDLKAIQDKAGKTRCGRD